MIRRPPRSTLSSSSAASDVYKRQDAGQSRHPHRHHAVGLGPAAELSVSVVTPSPDGAIGLQRVPVHGTPGYGGDTGQPGPRHWHRAALRGPIAKLAVTVVTPSPDAARGRTTGWWRGRW